MTETRTFRTRWIINRDLPEAMAIDSLSAPCPMTEMEWRELLSKRDVIGWVAEAQDEEVIGFMLFTFSKVRYGILYLAVHPGWRRCGVASAMIRRLKQKFRNSRRRAITTMVPETCLPFLTLLKGEGFIATGVDRGTYGDDCDGIAMKFTAAQPVATEDQC